MEFYEFAPFDDRHRHHRPAALVASAVGNNFRAFDKHVAFLHPPVLRHIYTDADLNTFKAFDMKPPAGFVEARKKAAAKRARRKG